MDVLSIGVWGAFFGTALLLFLGAAFPLSQQLPRVALLTAFPPVLAAAYILAVLGAWPGGTDFNLRVQAWSTLVNCYGLSAPMFLVMRTRPAVWRVWVAVLVVTVGVGIVAQSMDPATGMLLASAYGLAFCFLLQVLLFSPYGLREDRLAWLAIVGVSCVQVGLMACTAIAAANGPAPWWTHAIAALAFMAHQVCMAIAMWARFSHLAELRRVRAFGSGYDPVTRMRSHADAGQLIGSVFSGRGDARVGAIVVTIANLYALENLHGRALLNQALFILAGRLRRTVPRGFHLGRLGPDCFLLLVRKPESTESLVRVAQQLRDRLARPVNLGSGNEPAEVRLRMQEWTAELGLGVLAAGPELRGALAVSTARSMSRTALAYPSRIACYCESQQQFVEVAAQAA